jgi:hypothetical protein
LPRYRQQLRRGVERRNVRAAEAGQQCQEARATPSIEQPRAGGHAGDIEYRAEERQ